VATLESTYPYVAYQEPTCSSTADSGVEVTGWMYVNPPCMGSVCPYSAAAEK